MPLLPPEDLDLLSTEAHEESGRVESASDAEDALFAWRANYDRRRTTRRLTVWSKRSVRVLTVAGAILLALFAMRAPSTEPEAAPIETASTDALGSTSPVLQEAPTPLTWDIGIIDGTLMIGSRDDTEWFQFDYAIQEPVYLQWSDEAGALALNSLECTNKLRGGLRRCYIGRSHGRIGIALDQGAAEGDWNIQACTQPEGGICMSVGSFPTPQLD